MENLFQHVGHLVVLGIRYLVKGALLGAAGWGAMWCFRDRAFALRALAFVGGAALLAAVLYTTGSNLMAAAIAFGVLAVVDYLERAGRGDAGA